jgi:hypothetical protein
MTAIGIGMSDREQVTGWEAIDRSQHTVCRYRAAAERIWKRRDDVIEAGLVSGQLDHSWIDELEKTAQILEGLASTIWRMRNLCSCRELAGDDPECNIHRLHIFTLAEMEVGS